MAIPAQGQPAFNLWTDPWITLERPDGARDCLGIDQALLRAHEYAAIYEPSPLIVVGVHRLLTAVLQAALAPQGPADLQDLWASGRFPLEPLAEFRRRFAQRFDLFSAEAPFMQSADLPRDAPTRGQAKTVAYLTPELPAATEIAHYRHGRGDAHAYCPPCAAGGLVAQPAFATSGGAGIRPSINGVPPIYLLPGGLTLFHSLAASVLLPEYQPEVASPHTDQPWWQRAALVARSQELTEVGYLHSLTFAPRRVRLHPERLETACTRCGRPTQRAVRTMVYEMGESRPKDSAFWFDPFAAYRLPTSKGRAVPAPVRPIPGKATWREFATLFLRTHQAASRRPRVLDQMAALHLGSSGGMLPFRCVGMRTDMKMKVFEWVDADFQVPAALLPDPLAGLLVGQAIEFAGEASWIIRGTFDAKFGGVRKSRSQGLKAAMEQAYWATLSDPFRQFVLRLAQAHGPARDLELDGWLDFVVREAQNAFERAAAGAGDESGALRARAEGERLCAIRLHRKRKEYAANG